MFIIVFHWTQERDCFLSQYHNGTVYGMTYERNEAYKIATREQADMVSELLNNKGYWTEVVAF